MAEELFNLSPTEKPIGNIIYNPGEFCSVCVCVCVCVCAHAATRTDVWLHAGCSMTLRT